MYLEIELLPEDKKKKKRLNTHLSSLALCSAPPRNEHKQQSCHKEETGWKSEVHSNALDHNYLLKTRIQRKKKVSLSEES